MSVSEDVNLGGRPRKEIDIDQLANMASVQCTAEECAKILEVDIGTIDARLKEAGYAGFSEFYKRHCEDGKMSLRRAQFKAATEEMNPTMLVWLGKQYLNQKDAQHLKHDIGQDTLDALSDADLTRIAKGGKAADNAADGGE